MKWWFSDFDGTISLSYNKDIDKRDLNFINKWIAQGNKFTVATGRMISQIKDVLEDFQIPYNYIICNNGSVVYEKEKGVIAHNIIPKKNRAEILKILKEIRKNYMISYCLLDKRYDYSTVQTREIDSRYTTAPKSNRFEMGDKDILESDNLNTILFYINQEDAERVKAYFSAIPELKAIRTHTNMIEVVCKNVSKAKGIEVIQEIYGFNDEHIIASGDGENDIEMLEKANLSFVMTNHQPGVSEYANHVISNVFEIEEYI